ncbi:MAG: hypothetical protein IT215_08085 [Chitinophagaceae bacterium]|nr:hypothetical protein [Chitinophagaceae bacterium]
MNTKLFFALTAFSFAVTANAQKPFKEIGKDNEVDVLTLSNGRYIEYFTYDTLRQIGSVMFNTKTHKVQYFIAQDDSVKQKVARRAKEASRFMSPDPLARQFPFYSPYQYAGNKPISSIDADGLEDVDYRLVETYQNGSAYVKVGRSENSTANSHNGNLQIHNLNDGKTYSNFEWSELNTLFGIDQNSSFVGDKINPAGPAGPGSYSFRLSDPSDIIRGGKETRNIDGTKNVVSFSALVSKERTVTPYNSIGGSISSVADTPENTQNFLLNTTKDLINPNQNAFNQSAEDVTEINISVGMDEYKNISNNAFTSNLQSIYKNAKINIIQSDSDTGFSVEYKGTEAKQKPVPITE